MSKSKVLNVHIDGQLVGTMAETADRRYAFAYDKQWLKSGYPISPFSLPLEDQVFVPTSRTFYGLWGVFADSLPDAWGQLLVDRMLKSRGIDPAAVSQLERLAIVGASGMGALTYRPAWEMEKESNMEDLDELAASCQRLLNHEDVSDLDTLFRMGGSSGGARPKVMTDEWIIKFPAKGDRPDSGLMEKAYMDCAADCGIIVPESKIMPSRNGGGYFAVRRFDRERMADGTLKRVPMLSAAALLELDWRTPSMDYHTLIKLTKILCMEHPEDMQQMFRRACFNVFAHNRDDHAKNFSFVYDARKDLWHVSPAYDLTCSTTYWGEHTTTVDGNGADPSVKELTNVGKKAGLSLKTCKAIIEEVRERTAGLAERFLNG